ncbi:hypothetical protein VP1G_01662 [Cytospora mali]|uniref:Allergen n=1 Tax=Cytospora mali TaxID=578113 RepID=A0A194URB3_CYTMA|nr:hypothetical protein VP1G_01662 [Valsa mali var. pyri (nom. inval.)]
MEAAKAAVFKHLSRDGHHETEVQEHIKPAVQHEHVQPTQHEKVYRPMDKEVHREHHHTTVQPITDKEVLPEKHSHIHENTEHKEFRHGDHDRIKDTLSKEHARLGLEHTREVGSTTRTAAEAPTAQGEHVHHHVHEHVQPVIEKDVIQPHVVHHTKPVHEVHHHEPTHHSATTLPPVSIDEFKRQGGHVQGETGVRRDDFRGEPGPLESGYIGGSGARGTTHLTRPEHEHGNRHEHGTGHEVGTTHNPIGQTREGGSGIHEGNAGHNTGKTPISDHYASQNTSTHGPSTGTGRISPTTSASSGHKKASLLDKLNPKKDSDGDGKAGFMK